MTSFWQAHADALRLRDGHDRLRRSSGAHRRRAALRATHAFVAPAEAEVAQARLSSVARGSDGDAEAVAHGGVGGGRGVGVRDGGVAAGDEQSDDQGAHLLQAPVESAAELRRYVALPEIAHVDERVVERPTVLLAQVPTHAATVHDVEGGEEAQQRDATSDRATQCELVVPADLAGFASRVLPPPQRRGSEERHHDDARLSHVSSFDLIRLAINASLVGWMRRVAGDEWELLPGARTVWRQSGQRNPIGLDVLASSGPGRDYAMSEPTAGSEHIHRLIIRRARPADEKAWAKHCPMPKDWQR